MAAVFLLLLLSLAPTRTVAQEAYNQTSDDSHSDSSALMAFKWSSDGQGSLASWKKGENACSGSWVGVKCRNGRVVYLVLEELQLTGSIDPLANLDQLQLLNLKGNYLNSSLPDMAAWTGLRLLNLSNNQFRGAIPSSLSALPRLVALDLSSNQLTGAIPPLASLSRLLIVSLQNNRLSGSLSELSLPQSLQRLNVSNNELVGAIPTSIAKFPQAAFTANPGLCGTPLLPCIIDGNPDGNPFVTSMPPPSIIPSTPSSKPAPPGSNHGGAVPSGKLSKVAIAGIVLGDLAVLLILSCFFIFAIWYKYSNRPQLIAQTLTEKTKTKQALESTTEKSRQLNPSSFLAEADGGKLVFIDYGRGGTIRFKLDDLLQASAEMLGKGSFGTTYKASLGNSTVVAVKRLKDASAAQGHHEFEQHMHLISRLRHPHLIRLRAFYYSRDESLLVYDYLPNGGLYTLLHENRGQGRTPLDWTTRMKIALGAVRGIAYIHHECRAQKIPHGNIKSSNVLLDKEGNACISDFGLVMLASPSVLGSRTTGYRAPEHLERRKVSQKGDVYSFGVLLLELLTGKRPDQGTPNNSIDLPQWVQSVVREEWTAEVFDLELLRYKNIESEMVSMLQVAMACVSDTPHLRPRISHVANMIEEVVGDAVNNDNDADDNRSSPRCHSFDSTSRSSTHTLP